MKSICDGLKAKVIKSMNSTMRTFNHRNVETFTRKKLHASTFKNSLGYLV